MGKRSAEFNEGFNSIKYLNLHTPGTFGFNEYERGWLQRLKRGLPVGENQNSRYPIDQLTYAMNKHKPTSVVVTKKATLNELIRVYGHSKVK